MSEKALGEMGAEIAQLKETIRKMNRYCAELEGYFREIGRIATGFEEDEGPADISAICEKALGDTGVRCFWYDADCQHENGFEGFGDQATCADCGAPYPSANRVLSDRDGVPYQGDCENGSTDA